MLPRTVQVGVAGSVGLFVVLSVIAAAGTLASGWEVDATATVTWVIDGDTFDSSPAGRVRLADIDAPEYYESGYQEARDFLSGLIDGQLVYLDVDDVYGTDPYDRIVAVVYARHNATHLLNVNWALLDTGLADLTDYTNEFDPTTWESYVFYPVEAPPPSVDASASPTQGPAPLTVTFSSTASGGIPPYSFTWYFGDGSTSALQTPSHTYLVAGTYTVTLAVTDAASRSTTEAIQVTVGAPLSVTASANRTEGTLPLTVTFGAAAAGGSPPYTFHWDFGDGSTSTSPNPSHTYESPGTYTATITVTDADSRMATNSVQIRAGADASPGTLLYAAALAAVAVAGTLTWLRFRRPRVPPPSEPRSK